MLPDPKRKAMLSRWNDVLDKIDLPPETVMTWFSNFEPISFIEGTLTIATDSTYHFNWCRKHYPDQLSEMNVKLVWQGIPVERETV
ncbi:hypothetical protein ES703_55845 [subsurface metagenome]